MRVLYAGQGPCAMVLWPGLGGTAEAFLRLLGQAEAKDCLLVALDPPGHGLTDPLPLQGGQDAALVWRAVLEAFDIRRAVLAGHSYGAVAALSAVAADHGLRSATADLLLYDGGYLHQEGTPEERHSACRRQIAEYTFRTWDAFLERAQAEAPIWDSAAQAAARAMMMEREGRVCLRVDARSCADALDLIAAHGPEKLAPVDVPRAMLLRAGRPEEMEGQRRAGVAALMRKLPSLDVRVLGQASHELLDEAPEAVADNTWSFLAGIAWQ